AVVALRAGGDCAGGRGAGRDGWPHAEPRAAFDGTAAFVVRHPACGGCDAVISSTRLVSLRWRPFRLGMRHRFQAAHGALDDREGVLMEVRDVAAHRGVGEAAPMASLGLGDLSAVIRLLESLGTCLLDEGAIPDGPGASALRC